MPNYSPIFVRLELRFTELGYRPPPPPPPLATSPSGFNKAEACPDCEGGGVLPPDYDKCPKCGGTGSNKKVYCLACDAEGFTYPGAYLREEARPQGMPARVCHLCGGKKFIRLRKAAGGGGDGGRLE